MPRGYVNYFLDYGREEDFKKFPVIVMAEIININLIEITHLINDDFGIVIAVYFNCKNNMPVLSYVKERNLELCLLGMNEAEDVLYLGIVTV